MLICQSAVATNVGIEATHMMRKLAIFMNTDAFESHPSFRRDRIMPEMMPIPMHINIAPMKQIDERDSCSIF